jgi:sec-independent protein translocase protein TatA
MKPVSAIFIAFPAGPPTSTFPPSLAPLEMAMTPLFGFIEGAFSPSHILVVLVVGFILFGKKFPEMGRMLGKGIAEFKDSLKGIEDQLDGASHPHAAVAAQGRPPQRVATLPPAEAPPSTTGV